MQGSHFSLGLRHWWPGGCGGWTLWVEKRWPGGIHGYFFTDMKIHCQHIRHSIVLRTFP